MAAVELAAPWQKIRLAPGRYCEQLLLEKEVHIVGPREAVVEWHRDVTVHCRGPASPSIRGITIRCTAAESPAVRIGERSRTLLEDCDVSAAGLSGVIASGAGTVAVLRNNVVHDCGEAGVLFAAHAKGIVEGNELFGNAGAGLVVDGGADPEVLRNAVRDNREAGILVTATGRGTLEENDVVGNEAAGARLLAEARLVQRSNRAEAVLSVYPGLSVGEVARWAAPGQAVRLAPGRYPEQLLLSKDVRVFGPREALLVFDAGPALVCSGPFAPRVEGITIRGMAGEGPAVLLAGGSRAVLEACDVSSALGVGVEVSGAGTEATLRGCAVHGCGQAGVVFHGAAGGALEACEVAGNDRAGVWIGSGADPLLRGNTIRENGGRGVLARGPQARGRLEENVLLGNAEEGVEASEGAEPAVGINRQDGDLLLGPAADLPEALRRAARGQTLRLLPGRYRGCVRLEQDVTLSGSRDVVLESDAGPALHCTGPEAPAVEGITIRCTAGDSPAVRIDGGSRAVLVGCEVGGGSLNGVEVSGAGTEATLRRCAVHGCARDGLFFFAAATGLVEESEVHGNGGVGVAIGSGADPLVRRNRIHSNGAHGVHVLRDGRGTVEANELRGNGAGGAAGAGIGIDIMEGARAVLRNNLLL